MPSLFVAGGARIYDTSDFSLVADYNLAGNASSKFVNDVILTDTAAYFTESMRAQFYTVRVCALGSHWPMVRALAFFLRDAQTLGHIAADGK